MTTRKPINHRFSGGRFNNIHPVENNNNNTSLTSLDFILAIFKQLSDEYWKLLTLVIRLKNWKEHLV